VPSLSFFIATFVFERWIAGQAKATVTIPAPETAVQTVAESMPGIATPHAPEIEPWTVPDAPGSVLDDGLGCDTQSAPEATENATPSATETATETATRTRQRGAAGSDMERRARRVLRRQPEISGADLGRALGTSPRTGQRLLAAVNGSNGQEVTTDAG